MAREFLGTGMAFPPQVDPATGRFVTSSGNKSVKESIYLILMTQTTERLVRPNFGTDVQSWVFMNANATMLGMMRRDLTERILSQEPRIESVDITTEAPNNQGYVLVNINYLVAGSNTRDNLVFPFYLQGEQPQEEEETEYYEPTIIDSGEEV